MGLRGTIKDYYQGKDERRRSSLSEGSWIFKTLKSEMRGGRKWRGDFPGGVGQDDMTSQRGVFGTAYPGLRKPKLKFCRGGRIGTWVITKMRMFNHPKLGFF